MLGQILAVRLSETELSLVRKILGRKQVFPVDDNKEALQLLEQYDSITTVFVNIEPPSPQDVQLLLALVSSFSKKLRIVLLGTQQLFSQEMNPIDLDFVTLLPKPFQEEQVKEAIERATVSSQQQYLEEQANLFNAIFYQAPIGISISHRIDLSVEPGKERFDVNPMYEKITGRSMDELSRLGWTGITHPDDLSKDLQSFKRLKRGEIESYNMEKRFIRPDGTIVWVDMMVAPLESKNSHLFAHICLIQDISKRKETERLLAESERSKSALLSHLPGMAYRCRYDAYWTMIYVSAGCETLTGYSSEQLINNRDISFNEIIVSSYRQKVHREWEWSIQENKPFELEYEILTSQGQRKWVWEMGQAVSTEDGVIEALEGIILDVTDRKQMEQSLAYRNGHDLLTGLYNRRYLEQLLLHDSKRREKGQRALISINLSTLNTKTIVYGYQYSQGIMKKVADGLGTLCNDVTVLSITHEYRFVFYLRFYQDHQNLLMLCKKISITLEYILSLERISWGLGVLEIDTANQESVEQLLRNLLVASQRSIAQFDERAVVCFFDKSMEIEIQQEEQLTAILARIVSGRSQDRLFLQYQPIVDMRTGRICGFEALARLECKELGLVSPLQFIPIAEKTKLIIPLGDIIIRQAFQFLKDLEEQQVMDCTVSINISAIQMVKDGFAEYIIRLMESMDVDPACVCLELTESIFASNYQEINRVLKKLQKKGVGIAIDDFGSGYSSLSRERELTITELKIDKSFIDKLLLFSDDQVITGDIISMAHKLGHNVVAEGIEEQRQLDYLRRNNCDKAQGFLFSKPLDYSEALALCKRRDANGTSEYGDLCK